MNRKADHVYWATSLLNRANQLGTVAADDLLGHLCYEPLLKGFPGQVELDNLENLDNLDEQGPRTMLDWPQERYALLGRHCRYPFWISSMTGAFEGGAKINLGLAQFARRWGLGMGVGSIRSLLGRDKNKYWKDFALRPILGNLPFAANLGFAQLAAWQTDLDQIKRLKALWQELDIDALCVHLNPLQEWLQPEGDRWTIAPAELISWARHEFHPLPIILKEVGQGMGRKSLTLAVQLLTEGNSIPGLLELAGAGGTNFAEIELNRKNNDSSDYYSDDASAMAALDRAISGLGESTPSMLRTLALSSLPTFPQLIISGGMGDVRKAVLCYQYAQQQLKMQGSPFIGLAAPLLKALQQGERALDDYFAHYLNTFRILDHFCLRNDNHANSRN